MSAVEFYESVKGKDLAVVSVRLNYQYVLHKWKDEQAHRLYRFLSRRERFTREELKLWLYRERYLFRRLDWESPFVKRVLSLIIDELAFKGYIESRVGCYEVLVKPPLDECRRILQIQHFDLAR